VEPDRMELRTERLLLRPMPLDEAQAVDRGERDGRSWSPGYPAEGDVEIARVVLRNPPRDDLETLFGTRQIVDRRTGLVIGALGFFGPPDETGTVEIGYGVVPEARGQGVATEAVAALLAFADGRPEVRKVVASTDLDNFASQRVLVKSGLRPVHADEQKRFYERPSG
jgi:RimJ/RimL family protein N-acetyltransferase